MRNILILVLALVITAAPVSAAHKSKKSSDKKEAKKSADSKDRKEKDKSEKNDSDKDKDKDEKDKDDKEKDKDKDESDYQEPEVKSVSDGEPGTGHRFPYGQCTWYVSMKKYIPWSGNARTWFEKARSMGFATGWDPKKGSVAVFGGTYFGHVGLVEEVSGDQVSISEMNYQGFGRVNYRNINANDPTLIGFIY